MPINVTLVGIRIDRNPEKAKHIVSILFTEVGKKIFIIDWVPEKSISESQLVDYLMDIRFRTVECMAADFNDMPGYGFKILVINIKRDDYYITLEQW